MSTSALQTKRITQLVEENYVHAYVLYYFGIRFDDYPEHTLENVCAEKGLSLKQVIRELENPTITQDDHISLISCPVDLIIEYLKHTHFLFIKHKLPYICRLVNDFKAQHDDYRSVERDLKVVFPLFVEDFIHHIYEEEDTLFRYIKALDRASRGNLLPTRLYYLIEKHSIQKFAIEHDVHDDEMEGIRKITNGYTLPLYAPLHVKVIYNELKAFEKSLVNHARIENEILFPKAMALETKVKQQFFDRIRFN
ncbi:hemerythrin domain-containing protein [Oscillatoria amoena NRMC-F 0135]|nr:hemerythrin domain-containing protein [Oscillatoria amoena NRMC-F 0135]